MRAEARQAATERFNEMVATTDRSEIDRLLAEWWTDVLTQDSQGDQWESEQVEKLLTKCAVLAAESQNFGLTIRNMLTSDGTNEDREIGAILLGESAAAIVRSSSSAVELDRAVTFLSERGTAIEVMIDQLLKDPTWPEALDTLNPTTSDLAGLLDHHSEPIPANDILLEEEQKNRERGLLAYFWGHPIDTVCLNQSTRVRLELLAARSWQDLAHQAETLPLRELRVDLWRHLLLCEDRDAILSLLNNAPPVFTVSEWTGNTSALAGLVAAVAYSDKLHAQLSHTDLPAPNIEEKLEALVEHEIPDLLRQVIKVAFERPDGRMLLLFFGASLIREALRPPWNDHPPWSSAPNALCAIRSVLTPKPTVSELQQVARVSGVPSNRTSIDYATYLVTSAYFNACANDVWAWYRDLMKQSDDDLCRQAENWKRSLCFGPLAECLGQLTAPFEKWRAVWKELFVTDREHDRFATRDKNALYPSLHLLRVGEELLRQGPSRPEAREFFEELFTHKKRLFANGSQFNRHPRTEPALKTIDAIDIAPRVLVSDWPQSLEPHRHLLTVAKNRIYIATLLLNGGAPFDQVEAAVETAGHHLLDTVAEMKQSCRTDLIVRRRCEIITTAYPFCKPIPQ